MMDITLLTIRDYRAVVTLKSGLHIGGGSGDMRIGGVDSPVVRHALRDEPYIPGSSIKGKIRSLLELQSGLMGRTEGKTLSHNNVERNKDHVTASQHKLAKSIVSLFGVSAGDEVPNTAGPTRLIFRDCFISKKYLQSIDERVDLLSEIKSENAINRLSATANPRFIERIPQETIFDCSIGLRVFTGDDEVFFRDVILRGFKLLTLDYLGGHGSRGYGRVDIEFSDSQLQEKFVNYDVASGL